MITIHERRFANTAINSDYFDCWKICASDTAHETYVRARIVTHQSHRDRGHVDVKSDLLGSSAAAVSEAATSSTTLIIYGAARGQIPLC